MFFQSKQIDAWIASLQGEVVSLEEDVARLIADMKVSIAEANAFIDSMSGD